MNEAGEPSLFDYVAWHFADLKEIDRATATSRAELLVSTADLIAQMVGLHNFTQLLESPLVIRRAAALTETKILLKEQAAKNRGSFFASIAAVDLVIMNLMGAFDEASEPAALARCVQHLYEISNSN